MCPQFVDTNVAVYAFDLSAGKKRQEASALLESLWRSNSGALSIQVLQEFYVALTSKVERPIEVAEARRRTADLSRWRVHQPRPADVLEAIDIHRDYKISLWDAMIIRSASELDCDILWTEDLNAGQMYRGVEVKNPFA